MVEMIRAGDLPYYAQKFGTMLEGDKISDNVFREGSIKAPAQFTHIPEGEKVQVAGRSLVHVIEGTKDSRSEISSYFCASPATLSGPVLAAIESEAEYGVRAQSEESLSSMVLKKSFAGVLVRGGLFLLVALLTVVLVLMMPDTAPQIGANGENDIAQNSAATFNASADTLYRFSNSLIPMFLLFCLGMFLLFVLSLLDTLKGRGFESKSMSFAFPGALANELGVDRDVKSVYPLPASLNVKGPNPYEQALTYKTSRARLSVSRGIPDVRLDKSFKEVVVLEEGESYLVPESHIVSFWKLDSGGRHESPSHWRHVYCETPGTLHGPVLAALTPSVKPTFKTFVRNTSEVGGSAVVGWAMGFSVLASIFSVLFLGIAIKEDAANWVNHVGSWALSLAVIWAIGVGVMKIGSRDRALNLRVS